MKYLVAYEALEATAFSLILAISSNVATFS
jgi:hypothetical protein